MNRIPVTNDIRLSRIKSMYSEDASMSLRNSVDNPEVNRVYAEFYEKAGRTSGETSSYELSGEKIRR